MTANYEQAVRDHVIDLLEEDGRPIALIEIIPKPSHLLIENIAVLPERHREGIGGVLLKQAETIARPLGVNELRLYTNAKFSTNLSFYARRGFSEFLREPHVAGGEIVHMRKIDRGVGKARRGKERIKVKGPRFAPEPFLLLNAHPPT